VCELEVVAGVVPAALDVDRPADARQGSVGDDVVVGEPRGPEHLGLGVVPVRRLASEGARDDVIAAALGLEERDTVGDQPAVEPGGVGDAELRRRGHGRPGDLDTVRAGLRHGSDVDRVDGRVGLVPRAATDRADTAGLDDRVGRVEDGELRAAYPSSRHQVGELGLAGQVADLVEADHPVDRGVSGKRIEPTRSALGGLMNLL
jgi:hypothetical protein